MAIPARVTAFAAAALISAAASAQARERPPRLPPGTWNVNWGEHRCSLIRLSESNPPEYFAVQVVPGSYRSDVRVVSRNWPNRALSNPDRLTLTFEPQGTVVDGIKGVEETRAGRAFVIWGVPQDLRDSFAAARSVRVARNGVTVIEIPVPASARALAAFRECEVTAMRDWGIDPDVNAAVRVPPRGNLAAFVSNDDYPSAALRAGAQGTSIFMLDIDREGRVTGCRILASSGNESLDNATCRVMRERGRLEPAIGDDGAPIAATLVGSIRWAIAG
ncbi:MAG: energy transducer TonB [Pseudomonadota bacterium]|nr:energy transducer TonB [Pseudomonadota bacterium]